MSNEFYIFGGEFHNTGANIKQQTIIVQGDEPTAKEERPATPRVVVRRVTSWKEVLNAARFTQRKPEVDHEPSDEFKQRMIKAEHSPFAASSSTSTSTTSRIMQAYTCVATYTPSRSCQPHDLTSTGR